MIPGPDVRACSHTGGDMSGERKPQAVHAVLLGMIIVLLIAGIVLLGTNLGS